MVYYGRIISNALGKQSFCLSRYIMKILSWNVRGAGHRGFIQHVHELVNLYHPNILFFMVIKVNSDRSKMITKIF